MPAGSRSALSLQDRLLIPATRAGYLHAVAVQDRLFLGMAMLFTSVAAAVTYEERRRRRPGSFPT